MKNLYPENSILLVKESNILNTHKKICKYELKGIKVMTLNTYLQSFNPTLKTNWTLNYEILQRFKKEINQLHYFKSNALSSEFIKECHKFLDNMHRYSIQIDQLPTTTKPQEELKLLLSSIYDLKTEASYQQELLNSIQEIKNVYIDIQHPNFEEKQMIDILLNKGAKQIQYPETKPNYKYYTANNQRCEIEGIAQMIIKNELNIQDVLLATCDSSYTSIIESVFDRYQLPIQCTKSKSSSISFRCIALLEFACNPNTNTYMNCLKQGCIQQVEKIIEAQNIYPYNHNEEYPIIKDLKTDLFNTTEIMQIIQMIEQANIQKQPLIEIFDKLSQTKDMKELFILIDEILRKNISSTEDETCILNIQRLFIDAIHYIHEKDDLKLLIDEIKNIKIKTKNSRYNTITVLPYSQINDCFEYTFVCGATQQTFNEFKPLSGIFDEDYVQMIPTYPTLMKRYEHAHTTLINKIKNGKTILFSYPQSDYLGKNNEASLDIERIVMTNKPTYFKLIQTQKHKETITSLTKEVAHSIYLKENKIYGSISSLEKYVGCPYAYFLRYGCKIKEPVESGFNVQKIGTLNHSILETLVERYGKDYTKATIEEVSEIVNHNIEDMKKVFPHLQFDVIAHRLIESMMLNMHILNDMEQASFMTPTYSEYKWTRELPLGNNTLSLVGYIDRIDVSPTAFRIIDYKSSSKQLEKDKVFSGQQLQLCTYLMQMNDELPVRPLGGFYYSFMNSKLSLPYQKLSRREKELNEISKELIEKELIKNNRLQGWIFDENVEIMDDTATHVKGVSYSKNKGVYARTVYDLDQVKDCILEMMQLIAKNILSGNIKAEPNEAACMFCKYKPICRFNGSFTEKKQLVEYPECMRKEKDDE